MLEGAALISKVNALAPDRCAKLDVWGVCVARQHDRHCLEIVVIVLRPIASAELNPSDRCVIAERIEHVLERGFAVLKNLVWVVNTGSAFTALATTWRAEIRPFILDGDDVNLHFHASCLQQEEIQCV